MALPSNFERFCWRSLQNREAHKSARRTAICEANRSSCTICEANRASVLFALRTLKSRAIFAVRSRSDRTCEMRSISLRKSLTRFARAVSCLRTGRGKIVFREAKCDFETFREAECFGVTTTNKLRCDLKSQAVFRVAKKKLRVSEVAISRREKPRTILAAAKPNRRLPPSAPTFWQGPAPSCQYPLYPCEHCYVQYIRYILYNEYEDIRWRAQKQAKTRQPKKKLKP